MFVIGERVKSERSALQNRYQEVNGRKCKISLYRVSCLTQKLTTDTYIGSKGDNGWNTLVRETASQQKGIHPIHSQIAFMKSELEAVENV